MRDIVFLVCDALRYDHVTPEITPNIYEIGKKGVFFTNCHSGNTETEKSLPWILSGEEIYSPTSNIMNDLRKYGYKSFLIHSNPVILPFSHGWDKTYYLAPDSGLIRKIKGLYRKNNFIRKTYDKIIKTIPLLGEKLQTKYYHKIAFTPYSKADELLHFSSQILNKTRTNPYFLWIHLMDPHSPYIPRKTHHTLFEIEKLHYTKPDSGRSTKGGNPNLPVPSIEEIETWKELYKQEIKEMDFFIGKFLSGLLGDEIIFIMSDHGEEFGEHGGFGHVKNKFVPELYHVPLIMVDGKRTGVYDDPFNLAHTKFLINHIMGELND